MSAEKGENVHVAVRVRPIDVQMDEGVVDGPGAQPGWKIDEGLCKITQHNDNLFGRSPAEFSFDYLFGPEKTNYEVYQNIAQEIVNSTMEGYNGTVFAYGQTASGKTHTMSGGSEEPGIVPFAIEEIFSFIESHPERKFLLRCSYLEIYNELINDLLAPENQNLKIHDTPDKGTVISGVKEEIILSPEQLLNLLAAGEAHRHVGCTDYNEQSSRSHSVLRLVVESMEQVKGQEGREGHVSCSSVLNLIDLAGSERATSQSDRRQEAAYINKSLLTLGTVISKLADNKGGHVPYRDSKITRILQPSLGGNARVAVVCCVNQRIRNYEETVNTLKFASRAKTIKNKARVNAIEDEKMMLIRYENEIKDLREALESKVAEGDKERLAELEAEKDKAHQLNEAYSEKLQQTEGEKQILEQKIQKLTKLILRSDADSDRPHAMSLSGSTRPRNQSQFSFYAAGRSRKGSLTPRMLGRAGSGPMGRALARTATLGNINSPLKNYGDDEEEAEQMIRDLELQVDSLKTKLATKENEVEKIREQTDQQIAALQKELKQLKDSQSETVRMNQQMLDEIDKRDKFMTEWRGVLEGLVEMS